MRGPPRSPRSTTLAWSMARSPVTRTWSSTRSSFQYQSAHPRCRVLVRRICVADLHAGSGLHVQPSTTAAKCSATRAVPPRPAAACSRPSGRWPADANGYLSILPARTSSSRRLWMAMRVTRSAGRLRGDPSLPPPIDQLCISNALVHSRCGRCGNRRSAVRFAQLRMNAFSVAVGNFEPFGRALSRAQRRTSRVARGGCHVTAPKRPTSMTWAKWRDASRRIRSRYMNPQCVPGVAVRWDRDGRERALPHLPGAVSSRAYRRRLRRRDRGRFGRRGAVLPATTDNSHGTRRVVEGWPRVRPQRADSHGPQRITLTYAYSVNRRGQITAGGYDNDEPLAQCATVRDRPRYRQPAWPPGFHATDQRMYVLTPVGR